MSGESSYFSRFFVKFIEVGAAGLASAICGYLLAHFGGFLPAPAPAPAVQAGPTTSEPPESRRAQPSPPVALCAAAGYRRCRDAARAEEREGRQSGSAAQAHKDRYERDREGASSEIGGSPRPGRTRQCRCQSAGTA